MQLDGSAGGSAFWTGRCGGFCFWRRIYGRMNGHLSKNSDITPSHYSQNYGGQSLWTTTGQKYRACAPWEVLKQRYSLYFLMNKRKPLPVTTRSRP
ncbi:hypothetical protein KCP75_22895 [Salmonella enterica subsp. enterica]|nr:hypothetical protein KCP75_22895 [Salmonella enterica subsp. enterica]